MDVCDEGVWRIESQNVSFKSDCDCDSNVISVDDLKEGFVVLCLCSSFLIIVNIDEERLRFLERTIVFCVKLIPNYLFIYFKRNDLITYKDYKLNYLKRIYLVKMFIKNKKIILDNLI